jgi:hypothetical protein
LLFSGRVSFFSAVLFAVHPINLQTVAWVPGRNDSLLFIFFILSFITYAYFARSGKKAYLLTHFIFIFFALLTKESAAAIPFVLLIWHFSEKKNFNFKHLCPMFLLWLSAYAIFFILRAYAYVENSYVVFHFEKENFYAFFNHLSSIFFLRAPILSTIEPKNLIMGVISSLILCFMLFYSKTKKDFFTKLPFCILIFAFISIDFIATPVIFQGNRMYVAFFGIIVVSCYFYAQLFENAVRNKSCGNKIFFRAFFIVLLIVCASISLANEKYLKNGDVFWSKAQTYLQKVHNPARISISYLFSLIRQNRLDEALDKALYYFNALQYKKAQIAHVISQIYLLKGDYVNAARYFTFLPEEYEKHVKPYLLGFLIAQGLNDNETAAVFYDKLKMSAHRLSEKKLNEQIEFYKQSLKDKKFVY